MAGDDTYHIIERQSPEVVDRLSLGSTGNWLKSVNSVFALWPIDKVSSTHTTKTYNSVLMTWISVSNVSLRIML
jgi:hypothetical protein